jgi:hypothetical protein
MPVCLFFEVGGAVGLVWLLRVLGEEESGSGSVGSWQLVRHCWLLCKVWACCVSSCSLFSLGLSYLTGSVPCLVLALAVTAKVGARILCSLA